MKRIIFTLLTAGMALSLMAQNEINDTIAGKRFDEVVVKGEKPQIKGQHGVMVVDLPHVIKDKPVTNVLDALSYLPGVVSNNGIIELNGAASLSLIINGEPAAMPQQNLYQLLYATPVDRLKSVEIMYSAPPKYHAAGAVINIVLKEPRPLDGLMGQAVVEYNQTHYATYSTGLNATYAIKDWTFDLGYSLARNHSYSRQQTYSNHLVNGERLMVDDDMRQITENMSHTIHAAISLRKMKLFYNGQIKSALRNRSISIGTFGSYSNIYKGQSPTSYHNINISYDAPFNMSVGADYTHYFENRTQNLSNAGEAQLCSDTRQVIDRYHLYIDQEHNFGGWAFGYGAEYQHADDKSRQSYIFPAQSGFDNTLHEDVGSVYVSSQASFQWGLSFNVSIAAEYFHNDYQCNWNMIPQLGATYFSTPKSIFQLNFTSRRIYPSYWELHGGTSYVNDYSMILGNPELQPYIAYSGQLSYILQQKYAATLYLLYSDSYSVQLPYQSTDDFKLIFQTLNMDFSRSAGLQIHVPFEVEHIWSATATLNISHSQQKSKNFHGLSFDNKHWGVYAGVANTIRLSSELPVSLSIDGSYIAGQIQGPGCFSPLWKIDAGIKWQFGTKRCCELDFKANDIFNTCNPDMKINFAGQDYRMKAYDMNQNFKLAFIYRFNGFKPKKEADIDISRFGAGQ